MPFQILLIKEAESHHNVTMNSDFQGDNRDPSQCGAVNIVRTVVSQTDDQEAPTQQGPLQKVGTLKAEKGVAWHLPLPHAPVSGRWQEH